MKIHWKDINNKIAEIEMSNHKGYILVKATRKHWNHSTVVLGHYTGGKFYASTRGLDGMDIIAYCLVE